MNIYNYNYNFMSMIIFRMPKIYIDIMEGAYDKGITIRAYDPTSNIVMESALSIKFLMFIKSWIMPRQGNWLYNFYIGKEASLLDFEFFRLR